MEASHEQPSNVDARRNPDSMFEEVCTHFVWHGRTRLVNDILERRLCKLDGRDWYFVRGFSICSVSIPFVLFGPAGVYLLCGSRGYWTCNDITAMDRAAGTLKASLEGYPDPVHPAIVMLGEHVAPRQYFAGSGEGPCWILGERLLDYWLQSFCDRGMSKADIEHLRVFANPERSVEPRRLFTPQGEG